jgi:hypothetical protein
MTTPVLSSPTATNADHTTSTSQGQVEKEQSESNDPDFKILLQKDFGFIPVPRHLRYDSTKPFHFGLLLNIAFGFASTFSESFDLLPPPLLLTRLFFFKITIAVANLYYCQPLLSKLFLRE